MKLLDVVMNHMELIQNGKMTKEESKAIISDMKSTGSIQMPKVSNSREFSMEPSEISNTRWDNLEQEYHQSKLINSDV